MADNSVEQIWRYPVKSMAGGENSSARGAPRGLFGCRVYALVGKGLEPAAPPRSRCAGRLSYRSQFLVEPELDAPSPAVRITSPDGRTLTTTDSTIDDHLSAVFGRSLTVMTTAPAGLLVEFPPGTLGGKLSDATQAPLAGS